MNFCSVLGIFAIAAARIVYCSLNGQANRTAWLSILNAAFLVAIIPTQRGLVALLIFVGVTYLLATYVASRPLVLLVSFGIISTSFAFALLKGYDAYVPLTILLVGQITTALALQFHSPNVTRVLLWMTPAIPFACLFSIYALAFTDSESEHVVFASNVIGATMPNSVELIGLSYMFFRFIHVFVDAAQGQIPKIGFITYCNYQLGLATLVAGPIQRYEDFRRDWDSLGNPAVSNTDTMPSWNLILNGMIKMSLFAPPFLELFRWVNDRPGQFPMTNSLSRLALVYYSYPFYLYLNFSGYTDIARGIGCLQEIRLPENFNHPFLARNLIEYWDRWHMSLTHWIRDYIFMTSYKATVETKPAFAKAAGYLLIFFSLFIAGIWHGTDSRYAVFGILHGLGAVVSKIYGEILREFLGRDGFRSYLQSRTAGFLARITTFHFVCFTLLYFSLGVDGASQNLTSAWSDLNFSSGILEKAIPTAVVVCTGLLFSIIAPVFWFRCSTIPIASLSGSRTGMLFKTVILSMFFIYSWAMATQSSPPTAEYLKF